MVRRILSLCDYSGVFANTYRALGYEVRQVDLQHGEDVRLLRFDSKSFHGIIAQPPCTHFARSGARFWKAKGNAALIEGLALVDACLRAVCVCINPRGGC